MIDKEVQMEERTSSQIKLEPPKLIESKLSSHFKSSRGLDEKIKLEWRDLQFSILQKGQKKTKLESTKYEEKSILNSISGSAESGDLLAIMGPTGCGKTSLLNILAARVPNASQSMSHLSGSIQVNGVERDDAAFRSVSAYVLQDDSLFSYLTVQETFSLAARFFLPLSASAEQQAELVDAVIAELGLSKCRDTYIGSERVRGISGGERRRASIGVQLIADPAVLFLDEPTSGLDAFQALSVMEAMKSMASNGRLVISVIHQPRSSIFYMFDRLVLLSEGRLAYNGPCSQAVDHFASLGYPCPPSFNPADFFLDILSPDTRSAEALEESQARIQRITEHWASAVSGRDEATTLEGGGKKRNSKGKNFVSDLIATAAGRGLVVGGSSSSSSTHDGDSSGNIDNDVSAAAMPHVKQVGTGERFTVERLIHSLPMLSWRAFAQQARNITAFKIKLGFTIFFSLLIGGIYNNLGSDQSSIQNRTGVIFFVIINQSFPSVLAVCSIFPNERVVVNRERSSNAYDVVTYFCSKFLIELPLTVLPCVLFDCIFYFIVGLQTERFGQFLGITVLLNVTCLALSLAVAAGSASAEAAVNKCFPLLILSIIFGGFYIDVKSLPPVLNLIPYLSIFRWSFEALCINEFTGLKFSCADAQVGSSCIATGEEQLKALAFDNHSISYPLFGLGMLLLGFFLIGLYLLERSQTRFMALNHSGAKYRKLGKKSLRENSSSDIVVNRHGSIIN